MAEQAAGTVASVVIGEITDRALSTVMRKLRSRSRPAATDEKLQRLETLVLKLRCAVEVSEKHAIESASLLEWRDRLREAAAEAGAVVLDFQRRAREEGGEAASTSAPGQQQQQPAAAAAIASTSTLYFTRSALCGMARRVRDVTRRLFSTDEDMKKLDGALEKMEGLSPDITQFLMTLQLEVSSKLDPDDRIRKRKVSKTKRKSLREDTSHLRCWVDKDVRRVDSEQRSRKRLPSAAEAPLDPETEARMLATVLERTLLCTGSYYMKKAAADRDMEGLEWLAEWAAVRREAVERGNAVLQTLSPGSDVIHKSGGALEEDGELYSFARAVERLAQDDPCFAVLVDLCPRKLNTTGPSRPSEI